MLHTMAVHRFGGSKGLRDRNAFESAVNQLKNIFYYAQKNSSKKDKPAD